MTSPFGLAVSLSVLCAALTAQQGSFTTIGTGCNVDGAAIPAIDNVGIPRVGASFVITYTGPNDIQPGLGLTDQPTLIAGILRVDLPIPVFDVLQPSTCTLYPSFDALAPMPPHASGTRFVDRVTVPVPNLSVLVGQSVFFQWMTPHAQCFFVGCGLGWVAFSDGAEAVIGA